MVTMGYRIDSLDICFGTQLADARCDTGVIYALGLMHVLIFVSPVEILGHSLNILCFGLSIMNLNLLWCYFSTNSRIDRREIIALCYFITNS